jgi:hypothetical protein
MDISYLGTRQARVEIPLQHVDDLRPDVLRRSEPDRDVGQALLLSGLSRRALQLHLHHRRALEQRVSQFEEQHFQKLEEDG